MPRIARNSRPTANSHFSVTNYDALDEENAIDRENWSYQSDDGSTRVFTLRNVMLSAVFMAFTVFAVSNFPFASKSSAASFSQTVDKTDQKAYVAGSKPNFVFVLIDDAGYHSIGYDSSDIAFATPYMSSLAKKGIIMDNYYTQESCAPARASLMTGRYPSTVGLQYGEIHPTENFGLSPLEVLIPEMLKQDGYKNYALGKWNLGHFHPQYLPTARGFDYFLGYMDGHSLYWSKKDPSASSYHDFMYANTSCYNLYDGSDRETYSTTLYKEKAVEAIEAHDFSQNPMFLYFAVQAAHDPFGETNHDGLDADYVGTDRYSEVTTNVVGVKRQQYAMSLMMLDDAVREIHDAIIMAGQKDNTYIMLASDNGGCYEAGGRNGPLRGSKGSLFEGGVKVDAFIYGSPQLLGSSAGTRYTQLMHVSDWFPTIRGLSAGSYSEGPDHALDGVDHSKTLFLSSSSLDSVVVPPRELMLYNIYLRVEGQDFRETSGGYGFALRNSRYKLMHYYENTTQSDWYTAAEEVEDDDNINYASSCSQDNAVAGDFNKYLFDLETDPYETKNLYNDAEYDTVKEGLYEAFNSMLNIVRPERLFYNSTEAYTYWDEHDSYVQPFDFDEVVYHTYPMSCESFGVFSPSFGGDDL